MPVKSFTYYNCNDNPILAYLFLMKVVINM